MRKWGYLFMLLEVLLLAAILFFALSCKSVKSSTTEQSERSDSLVIKTVEKLVKVPVTVYVEVPAEEKERVCNDSTSHLETSFAVSDAAMIWIDGVPFLRHNLKNKPKRIEVHDTVYVQAKDSISEKTSKENNVKKEYVKVEPTFWERARYVIAGAVVGAIIGIILTFILFVKLKRQSC